MGKGRRNLHACANVALHEQYLHSPCVCGIVFINRYIVFPRPVRLRPQKEAGMKRFCEFLAVAAVCCSVAAAVVLLLRRAKRRRPAPYLTLYNYD